MSNLPPLNTETIWAIIDEKLDDATVNQLLWHYLGYRYDSSTAQWDTSLVAPEWQGEYRKGENSKSLSFEERGFPDDVKSQICDRTIIKKSLKQPFYNFMGLCYNFELKCVYQIAKASPCTRNYLIVISTTLTLRTIASY